MFSTIIEKNRDHDPHKCPVIISSNFFDFNGFYKTDIAYNICTFDVENSWFQIELTQGFAVLNGFRIKRVSPYKPKSYKILGTGDSNNPESAWTTLIKINENLTF